jgi:hypothetical protein
LASFPAARQPEDQQLNPAERPLLMAALTEVCPAIGKEEILLRFFTREQADQILREGARRGRRGSHAAIERILRHEPGLRRADLWLRIRRLKNGTTGRPHCRSVWSPEDDAVLREGYTRGWLGKQHAVRELLRRHPDWRPHIVWRRAAKLGLTHRNIRRGRERGGRPWSEEDDRILLDLAGYKHARAIGQTLHRTESAVRYRLALLGNSSRVHREGYARRALAEQLHLGSKTIQRLIVTGLLEVRDPRITKHSIDQLCKAMHRAGPPEGGSPGVEFSAPEIHGGARIPAQCDPPDGERAGRGVSATRAARAKRFWEEAAMAVGVSREAVEQYILKGTLKLCDPRITERSLRNLCRRNGSLINSEFLDQETRAWLRDEMDLVADAGKDDAERLRASRKHAQVVRNCEGCGRTIRGNAFFRHIKRCAQREPAAALSKG